MPRVRGGRPFNPPHLIPLVEVVGGNLPETIAWCLDFYRHIGKRPIHIRKEAPGHLANRLQAALWREAVNAVVSGLASVEDVDTAISAGPGLRWAVMGPHMTFHLGGGDGGIERDGLPIPLLELVVKRQYAGLVPRPPIYCWLKPGRSSTCSCIRPFSRRIRANPATAKCGARCALLT